MSEERESAIGLPGFASVAQWPTPPVRPLRVVEIGGYRDATKYAVLSDAEGREYTIFFEPFLGRLCFGARHHTHEGAAFVVVGSALEADLFEVLERADWNDFKYRESTDAQEREFYRQELLNLPKIVARAKHWSPRY